MSGHISRVAARLQKDDFKTESANSDASRLVKKHST